MRVFMDQIVTLRLYGRLNGKYHSSTKFNVYKSAILF